MNLFQEENCLIAVPVKLKHIVVSLCYTIESQTFEFYLTQNIFVSVKVTCVLQD